MTDLALSPRGKLREWFEQRISEEPKLNIKVLEDEAKAVFLPDTEWVNAMFGPMLGTELRCLIGQFRRGPYPEAPPPEKKPKGPISVGDIQGRVDKRSAELGRKWSRYYEQTSEGYFCILDMTRPQLLEAAKRRRANAEGVIKGADFDEAIAARLPNDKDKVKKKLSYEDLETIQRSI